jgi:transposase
MSTGRTIMRIRTVAKEGALAALAASKPGVQARERDYELGWQRPRSRGCARRATKIAARRRAVATLAESY